MKEFSSSNVSRLKVSTGYDDRHELARALRESIPDKLVIDQLRAVLEEGDWRVEILSEWIDVPRNAQMQVVFRSYETSSLREVFGPLRATVAIGSVSLDPSGPLYAATCFATLYFSSVVEFVTVDFFAGPV